MVIPGQPVPSTRDSQQRWTELRRFGVFATLIFVVLFALPFPLGDIPFTGSLAAGWTALWGNITPWIADNILRLGYDVRHPTGGSEPTKEYIRIGCAAALAIIGGAGWALLDHGRTNATRIDQWLRLYLRLYLIGELFSYGLAKVIPNQFSPLGPELLSQSFGESTASGFLWAFMGYSAPYVIFAGLGETAAGILLCFRRTSTLGALIGIGVMSNVVALNFSYDVGVKLHSVFYLLGLMYLASADIRRLLDVFIFNRPTAPIIWAPLFGTPWKNALTIALSGVFCASLFVEYLRYEWDGYRSDGPNAAKPALYGLYDVESIRRHGIVYSTAPADSTNWSRLAIGTSRSSIRLASGSLGLYTASVDTMTRTVRFASRDDRARDVALEYARPDSGHLTLHGVIGQDSVDMRLVRRDEMAYRLMQRRFRWANDGDGRK
jgi:hypothetical protein